MFNGNFSYFTLYLGSSTKIRFTCGFLKLSQDAYDRSPNARFKQKYHTKVSAIFYNYDFDKYYKSERLKDTLFTFTAYALTFRGGGRANASMISLISEFDFEDKFMKKKSILIKVKIRR